MKTSPIGARRSGRVWRVCFERALRVLVTDGDTRAALAVTRSLSAMGAHVFVSAPTSRSLAGSSRHCTAEVRQPAASDGPAALADAIVRNVREIEPDHVIGITDPALTVIHSMREQLGAARVPPPSGALYGRASDKVDLFETSRSAGIAVPPGLVVRDSGDLPVADLEGLGVPFVVRPALSWRSAPSGWLRGPVSYEHSLAALRERIRTDAALSYPFLVQQRIAGEGCGLFVLAREGVITRVFAHRRLREKPPSGGVSTLCVSIAPPEDLVGVARRWTQALRFSGLAMLEFKRELRTGTAYLLEVNARPWGSMALAAASGIDFPALLLGLGDLDVGSAEGAYERGVRLRWWWGDVDHFFLVEKAGGANRAGAMLRGLGRALCAGPWPEAWDTFRRDDPVPFALESLRWITA